MSDIYGVFVLGYSKIISFIAVYIKINNNKLTHLDIHYFLNIFITFDFEKY